MPTLFFRDLKVLALCCLIVGGCGSNSTEGATQSKTAPSTAAKKASDDSGDSGSSPSNGAAWTCGNYAAGGVDYQSQSAAYLFIGDHPMCADKSKMDQFCKALVTRDGYTVTQDANAAADAAPEIAQSLPEESRDGFMQQHPKHAFEQAMAKCGLKVDDVRAKLVAEAEALIKTDSKEKQFADIGFLMRESPATAEAVWNRECSGRLFPGRQGEGYGTVFKGNPAYEYFCNITSTADRADGPLKFYPKATK